MELRTRTNPKTIYNPATGMSIRMKEQKPCAPELIDLKVTEVCHAGCPFCYMNATGEGRHTDLEWIINQVETFEDLPFQIALGGGEPTEWPDIKEFIAWGRKNNVSINTAVGPAAKPEVLEAITQDGLSAVGISYIDHASFMNLTNIARRGNAKVAAHCVLAASKIDYWIDIAPLLSESVEVITFLLYKPQGRGKYLNETIPSREQFDRLYETYRKAEVSFGFDSCCYPLITGRVPEEIIDDCDGGMYSLFVDGPKQTAAQCSFLDGQYDLKEMTLNEVWKKINRISGCKFQWGEKQDDEI